MAEDADAGFSRFVAERRPALLRTALLLAGDRAAAEELVQRALARARRRDRDRDGDRETAVLRALLAGATSRWSHLARTEQVIDVLPDPSAPAAQQRPELAAALRDLPARTRAVVVLRWHDSLPDERIAELTGRPVAQVRADAAAGLAQLGPVTAPSAYERAGAVVAPEDRLTAQLTRLAAAPQRWRLDSAGAVAEVRARRSATRRRLAAAVVAVLCGVGVAVPLARWAPDVPAPTAAPPSSGPRSSVGTASPPPIAPRGIPVLAGPARGSLAGDAAFVDVVRADGWGALEAPPPDEREVVYVGDTPNGRVALVVGTVAEDFRGVWLTGPVGASADQLVPRLPAQLGRERPVTLLLGGPGPASLVVVAGRGDEIAVSERLLTGPRGTVGRTYTPVDAPDGTAVVPARTIAEGPSLSVRVTRDGRPVYRSAVDWAGDRPVYPAPAPALAPLRPSEGTPDPHVVDAALTDVAVALGTEPAALTPQLLWSGQLPTAGGAGSVAVLVAHSPGGALVVTTWAGAGGGARSCGTQTPPGSTEVAGLTVARVCDLALPGLGQAGDGATLVLTAPPAAASAELLDDRDGVLGPVELRDGSALVRLPDAARTVRTLDAAGRPLREVPIAPPPTEPFGDFGSGPER